MQDYLLVCCIVFFAGFTKGLSGFGSVLVALPLLAIFLDIKTVVPFMMLCALSMTIILLFQLWKHLDWKSIYPFFLGALPGIPIGVVFLKKFDKDLIHVVLGVTLISYSIYSFFFKQFEKEIKDWWAYLFGFLSGCLDGALSSGGPPAIVYTSMKSWSKDKVKVTLQGYFLLVESMTVIFHAISGLTTLAVVRFFIISMPVLIMGTYVGSFLYGKLNDEIYKRIILGILAILGFFMIYMAINP